MGLFFMDLLPTVGLAGFGNRAFYSPTVALILHLPQVCLTPTCT